MTLTPSQDQGAGFAGPGGGSGGGGNRDLIRANQSVITDLSKLGKPGQHFVHDFFLPGTQLTFQQTAAQQIASLKGVAQVTTGLTLLAEHQDGIVPKIVAKLKTGLYTPEATTWVKIKNPAYSQAEGRRELFEKKFKVIGAAG